MLFCFIDDPVVHNQDDLELKTQISDFLVLVETKTNFGKPTLSKANQNKSSKQKQIKESKTTWKILCNQGNVLV